VDALVEFLFKYRPSAFRAGSLGIAPPVPVWLVGLGVLVVLAFAMYSYSQRATTLERRTRWLLGTLRTFAAVILGVALLRPVLVIAESVTQRNIVAVLVDDSRSMRTPDVAGKARSAVVTSLVGSADSALLKALAPRYQTRVYRVSASGRVPNAAALPYDGTRTRLLSSLLRVEDELAGAPVAGVVVLSDGADNSPASDAGGGLTEQLLSLRSRGVPVYTVGIGTPRFARDVEVSRIEVPRRVLRNSTVLLSAVITQRGLGGTRLPVVVEDSGRIVGSLTVTMPKSGEAVQVRLRVPATETGARLLRVHVPVQDGEMVRENNERRAMLVVADQKERILHVEGEPRFELKFLRRAVEGDPNLEVVTLLRSARDKFLRLGVTDSVELIGGFPKTREELFGYRGIVLGSIEASFFTVDQLRMLSDFVSERGGGLLFLGGRAAFAEGGYVGTPLADVMPFDLGVGTGDTLAHELRATPTTLGALHPALQIGPDDSTTAARWAALPPLTTVNTLLRTKPGATVLLDGVVGEGPATRPLLAVERFGRGRVMGLAAQDSWLWQMHASVAAADSTHEVLWRQLLRWLVADVPDRVEVAAPEEYGIGEAIPLSATLSDKGYLRVNGATVTGSVTGLGTHAAVTLDWAADRDGEYRGTIVADAPGLYAVDVQGATRTDTVAAPSAYVRVAEPVDEYFGAELRTSLLKQVAEETGGRHYTPANALDIARDIVYSPSGSTVVKQNDLWDMPALLGLLLLALGGEWWLRRRVGLA
jgi:uncharacterized membrane protein